jgi:DNA-binding transcriptional MerR regulator
MQQYQDLLIDVLLDQGFSLDEAQHLIALQDDTLRKQRAAALLHEINEQATANVKDADWR